LTYKVRLEQLALRHSITNAAHHAYRIHGTFYLTYCAGNYWLYLNYLQSYYNLVKIGPRQQLPGPPFTTNHHFFFILPMITHHLQRDDFF
jgi:hypothetical protein